MISAFLGLLFMGFSGLFGAVGTTIFLLLAAAVAIAGIIPPLMGARSEPRYEAQVHAWSSARSDPGITGGAPTDRESFGATLPDRAYDKSGSVGVSEKSFAEAAQNLMANAKVTRTEREGLEAGRRS